MRGQAVRMRKGILLGAGALALPCALGLHAGGAAAGMGLWMALLRMTSPCLPYPGAQKSRAHASRLFFAWTVCCFSLAVGRAVLLFFGAALSRYPAALPALRFFLPFPAAALCERAYALRLQKGLRVLLGILSLLSAFFIFCTR